MMESGPTLNIAAYKFISIPQPQDWVEPLKKKALGLNLKGTIILATEGMNLFLAGSRPEIDSFLSYLRSDSLFEGRFSDIIAKESPSQEQPFRKMVVRIAREIITMRHPTICPEDSRAAAVEPADLKRWIEQGHDDDKREIILLDTRNTYEINVGTFEGAVALQLESFGEFPAAVKEFLNSNQGLQDKTIVSFCTGGIRCEKAALFLRELGHPKVFQLDGGILRYFEDTGGAHWRGECFVFDERRAVDKDLNPTQQEID